MLLAHCSLAHSGLWKGVMAGLSGYRCMAPDMPGHGGADPPPPGVSLQRHAVAVARALVEDAGGPVHLVGLSLGGAVLGRLAVERPAGVASLTLIEPVYFHLLIAAGLVAAESDHDGTRGLDALIAAGDLRGAARAFMDVWGAPGAFDRADAVTQDYYARCLAHLAPDFAMVRGFPPGQVTLDDLAGLRMPTLLVSGARTHPSATAVCDLLSRTIPGARRAVIPEAGHLSPVSHPDAVARLLRGFFEDHP